jgi:hypothetical protein
MRELRYNATGQATATVTLNGGRGLWVCDEITDLQDAMQEGKPFIAHAVVAMAPKIIVLNPKYIATIESHN